MKFRLLLKERILYLLVIEAIAVSITVLLMLYNVSLWLNAYIIFVPIAGFFLCVGIEYGIKKNFYVDLFHHLDELQEKYLLNELIPTPDFQEGRILKEALCQTGKSMLENVNYYKHLTEDYKEYIELWIHEIKIPIAASKMIIENNKTKPMKSIDEELDKVENYIEQALYYARSNMVEKDYYIAKTNLQEVVNSAILKNKNVLLANKINIDLKELDKWVYTDGKWLVFILNQILQNAVKYMDKEEKKIKLYAEEKKEKVILIIEDNGMGVKKGEVTRVFDKGFTGENGRIIGKKSTGIGLYLCQKLCNRLGLGIEFNSEKEIGTQVRVIFPKSSFTNI